MSDFISIALGLIAGVLAGIPAALLIIAIGDKQICSSHNVCGGEKSEQQ